MRIGPIAHGALLVAALAFAYQTWTREKTEDPKVGTVTVWQESLADFEAFAYDGDKKSVRVERRAEGGHSYLWGQVTRSETKAKPRKPVKAPDESEAAGGGHGGHGGHGGAPGGGHGGLPGPAGGASKGEPGKSGPTRPMPPTKLPPHPSKSGAGAGPSTKPPPQSPSPHHAGTDQPGEPAATPAKPSTPAKPATPAKQTTPASPAKPAGGGAPTGESADPAGEEAESADAESESAEGGEGEGEGEGEADEGGEAAPAPEPTTPKSKEFPVGKAGEQLVANLVHLRALRELGVLTDKQKEEYSLTDSKENLTVFFKGGKQRSLIIGARVFGGGDRYVMNSDNGKGYVLSNSEIMRHVDGAENALGLKNLHRFQEMAEEEEPADPHDPSAQKKRDRYPGVAEIEVETSNGKRNLVRHEQADPQSGGTKIGWADKQKPGESDMTFANFLGQIERLKPVDYEPSLDLSKLTKILTVRYRKSGGNVMGTFEMYRKEAAVTPEVEPSDESKTQSQPEFYVKTELTRVPGKVSRMGAERVAEDIPQLFGAPPKDGGKGQKKPGRARPGQGGKPATGKAAPAPSGADNATPGAGDKSVPDKSGAGK
jgi:hypothetical protein